MAERIILQGGEAQVAGGDGASVKASLDCFVSAVRDHSVLGLEPEALADNVKWQIRCGPLTIAVAELKPQLRRVQWIAPNSPVPYGPQAVYVERRLATPYVVIKVPFVKGRVVGRAELFYRPGPLRTLDDPLFWCNLLNVSPGAYGCTAWLCTQYLGVERLPAGVTAGLDALVHHLFGGGFNLSSERHEGASALSKMRQEGLDARVTDLDRWEAESVRDPNFVLDVPWKPVGVTVGQLLAQELAFHSLPRPLGQAGELVNVLLGCANGKKGA